MRKVYVGPLQRTVKLRSGKTRVDLYVKLRWQDASGQKHAKEYKVKNKTEQRLRIAELEKEYGQSDSRALSSIGLTLKEAFAEYAKARIQPAQYRDGRQISGMRSHETSEIHGRIICENIGHLILREIRYGDLDAYRIKRLNTPNKWGQPRKIGSVNREMTVLSAFLSWCVRQGYIDRNPFHQGEPLIRQADVWPRERIITLDEEKRLLDACIGRRRFLRPVLITAIDTGMRKGDIQGMTWADVNLAESLMTVRLDKAGRSRTVAMTRRVREEIEKIWERSDKKPNSRVFVQNIHYLFRCVAEAAGIEDIHFHDLKRTALTRLVDAGVPLEIAAKTTGNSVMAILRRHYIHTNLEAIRKNAAILEEYRESGEQSGERLKFQEKKAS